MWDNLEEEPEPNLDQVIDNIQIEQVELVEFVVPIAKSKEPIVVAAETLQLVQPIIKHVHVENPQFFIYSNLPQFSVIL
jgi:hypothetical protein